MAGTVAAPILLGSSYILAQDGGLQASLTLGQRFEHVDESGFATPRDDGTRSITTLVFGLSSATRYQRLSFNVDTGLQRNFSNSDGFELEDPTVRLSYGLEARNSALDFDLRYREIDVDSAAFDEDPLIDDIETGTGTRENLDFSTQLTFGRNSPATTTLSHSYERVRFSDTVDPTLNDSDLHVIDAQLNLALSSDASVNAFATWRDRDEDGLGANDLRSYRVGVGASATLSDVTTASASLFYNDIETTESGRREGFGYSLGLTYQRPNGAVRLSFNEDDTVNGKRRQLTVGRSLALPSGDIDLSLGVTKTDGLSAQYLANLSVNYEINRISRLGLSLQQSSSVDDGDDETINTRLSLNYNRDLTPLQRLGLELQYVDQNVLGTVGEDQESIRLNLNHSYQLANDWSLVSGYSYSSVRPDGEPNRNTNRIFTGIQKTFAFRP